MRRSLAVLLSTVLTVSALASPHTTAAASESGTVANTWYTGTMEPGQTITASWKNVRSDRTYDVSISPVGASSSKDCQLKAIRVWNEQRPEGNEDFWYTIKNIDRLACAGTVMVYRIPAKKVRSTGGLAPLQTKTFTQSNLDDTKIYQVGLLPSGATDRDRCKLEVSRIEYAHRFQGDVATVFDVTYNVQNVGDIACQGDVLLGSTPIEHTRPLYGVPKYEASWSSMGYIPADTAYVTGLRPNVGCVLQLSRPWDSQGIGSDGTVARRVSAYAHNHSPNRCDGDLTFASI